MAPTTRTTNYTDGTSRASNAAESAFAFDFRSVPRRPTTGLGWVRATTSTRFPFIYPRDVFGPRRLPGCPATSGSGPRSLRAWGGSTRPSPTGKQGNHSPPRLGDNLASPQGSCRLGGASRPGARRWPVSSTTEYQPSGGWIRPGQLPDPESAPIIITVCRLASVSTATLATSVLPTSDRPGINLLPPGLPTRARRRPPSFFDGRRLGQLRGLSFLDDAQVSEPQPALGRRPAPDQRPELRHQGVRLQRPALQHDSERLLQPPATRT